MITIVFIITKHADSIIKHPINLCYNILFLLC